ncbi:MAG: PQQ-binding-like beta-propeller repeat protein, partial [Lentisphaeria bacterium]|nr:PQQ-binding-like beta-propeller repeat protein [Lentisphaeria bacterium]
SIFTEYLPLTGSLPFKSLPLRRFGKAVWIRERAWQKPICRAWAIDDLLFYAAKREAGILAFDPRTGETRFTIPANTENARSLWVSRGSRDGQLTVGLKDRVLTVETTTGKILRSISCKRDPGIAPVPVGNDLVLVPGHRAQSITRIDPQGDKIWERSLSGYMQAQPSVYSSLLMIQTRQNSYGGQATSGVDLKSGEMLWTDKTNAYGCGVVFSDNARYSVEGDMWLTPNATEGRLISRTPRTGAIRWTYRKPQTMLSHAPLLDPVTDRVFAVLDDGVVVCVDGEDGEVIWETDLLEKPLGPSACILAPYHSALSLSGGLLLVPSKSATLHLLDMQTGALRDRIALAEGIVWSEGIRTPSDLMAAPRVVDDLLIVPYVQGIRAYKHGFERYRPSGRSPMLTWLKPPQKRVETGTITLAIKVGSTEKELVARYRCDDGGWRKESFTSPQHEVVIKQLGSGPHICRIQIHESSGRYSTPLVHRFTVDCDFEALFNDLLHALGSEKYTERDVAEKRLLDLGPAILPHLERHRAHGDPEIRFRINRVIKNLAANAP